MLQWALPNSVPLLVKQHFTGVKLSTVLETSIHAKSIICHTQTTLEYDIMNMPAKICIRV